MPIDPQGTPTSTESPPGVVGVVDGTTIEPPPNQPVNIDGTGGQPVEGSMYTL